jgi:hypothetical protein
MPVVVNKNIYTGLKVVNRAGFTAINVIPNLKFLSYHLADNVTIYFGPPLGILLELQETKDLAIPVLPIDTMFIQPIIYTFNLANSYYRFLSRKCF